MKTYYDQDADIKHLKDRRIAIIGYGIQGQAQALNLRDAGCDIVIGNVKDEYYKRAVEEEFRVVPINKAAEEASIIIVLIPDQAQEDVFNNHIANNLKQGDMLIFAHGYSIHYKKIIAPDDVDVGLLAPRMPGKPIRDYFLEGGGVPAFVDVYQDASGKAWQILLAVAKGIGATRAAAMHITFKEETETDLFIEQFLLPLLIRGIRLSFDVLTEEGFTPEPALMELYASGEISELLMMAAKSGIYRVWKNNASPTCQFGIYRNSEKILPTKSTKKLIREVLGGLRDGSFIEALSKEAKSNYSHLHKYDVDNENCNLTKTQDRLEKLIKYRTS